MSAWPPDFVGGVFTVETFLTGSFKKQLKKASGLVLVARDWKLYYQDGEEFDG